MGTGLPAGKGRYMSFYIEIICKKNIPNDDKDENYIRSMLINV